MLMIIQDGINVDTGASKQQARFEKKKWPLSSTFEFEMRQKMKKYFSKMEYFQIEKLILNLLIFY